MKKLLSLITATALCLSLAACGGSASSSSAASTADSTAASTAESTEAAASDVALPKSIEVQLPASAGGGTDVAGRALTAYINSNSDSNMTIVNNTDGSGVVAFETVRTGKADGSEILFFHTSMCIKTAMGMYEYSAAEDFKIIGVGQPTEKGGYILVTPADDGIDDLDDFIAAAKEAGGSMMIGVETGGSSHIMAGLMTQELGIELNYVEAGADTDKLTALVGGSIDCALVNGNQAKQYIEAGKVNAIACFSSTDEGGRFSVLPDVPSFSELGYDLVYGTNFYVLANPEMDDATAQAILVLFTEAAADPDTAAILEGAGMGMEFVPYEDGPAVLKSQQDSLNEVCAALGLAG